MYTQHWIYENWEGISVSCCVALSWCRSISRWGRS
uniref:Uncharacterized protein n=1 Tax=Arundo donax TaxID=35708 RepID=A0A0A9LYH0_ARUDO